VDVVIRYQRAAISRRFVVDRGDANHVGQIAAAAALELGDDGFQAAARIEHIIDQQQLSVVTTLGANLQGPADVQVLIHSGDGNPLPIAAVRLEMRERKLCFDPRLARGGATLFYGDSALAVSHEAYAPVFPAGETTVVAQLGPETLNPGFHPRAAETLPLERRQQLLWAGMLIVISTTAMAVFVSSKWPR
jgi:hypothetical protein